MLEDRPNHVIDALRYALEALRRSDYRVGGVTPRSCSPRVRRWRAAPDEGTAPGLRWPSSVAASRRHLLEGIDPDALTFAFRPLWQMDAATAATVALQKAQATQIYAGLKLWPAAVTARLVEAQLAEDGTYPGAEAVFAVRPTAFDAPVCQQAMADFDPAQPRDPDGRWTIGVGSPGRPLVVAPCHKPGLEERKKDSHAPDGTPITFVQQTCADFIAANCKASILREFPGQYLDQPLSKVYEDAAGGSAQSEEAD